jgi:type II secretory pathway component PulC
MLRRMLVAVTLLSIAACAGGPPRPEPPAFRWEELRNSMTPEQMFESARAVPFFENGQAVGLKFMQIAPDSVFAKVGIRSGDVLVGVNGDEWAQPDIANSLIELRGAFLERDGPDPRSLRVRRDGATLDLLFRIE